jgi:hypothetical protein
MGGWQARGRVGNDKLVRNWVTLTLRFSIGLMTDLSAWEYPQGRGDM